MGKRPGPGGRAFASKSRPPFPKKEQLAPAPQPRPEPQKLTPEQRKLAEERYRAMVIAGERPAEGRRKKIAEELGVSYAVISDVVRNYLQHDRLRRTNFDIERIYWRELHNGQDDARVIAETAAAELKLDVGRIWWWLQKLHEWRKNLDHDPDVTDEQRAAILSRYDEYLTLSEPPEQGLHFLLAQQVGEVTPRQIHKALLQHRLSFWNNLKNIVGT
jgi:hypothetical protein